MLGYINQQGTVHLNPKDSSRPGPGSKLVLLSNGSECWCCTSAGAADTVYSNVRQSFRKPDCKTSSWVLQAC